MSEENFLLVSLKEDKAKKLAQVISNDTSRKILDFLTKRKDATESEIARQLGLPISTVHYNLQHLHEAKLIQAEEFHYSKKGKEVLHYSLTNKFVVIAPKETPEVFFQKLKEIMPVFIMVALAAIAIQIISLIGVWTYGGPSSEFAQDIAEQDHLEQKGALRAVIEQSEDQVLHTTKVAEPDTLLRGVSDNITYNITLIGEEVINQTFTRQDLACQAVVNKIYSPAIWFIFGAVFTIISFLAKDLVKKLIKN
ncbi:MAG: helix-turn-helix domain-containing protein [Candidatus Woesearchaeota archaeon]